MEASKKINGITLFLLLFLYLIVYQYVIPFIAKYLTLLLDSNAIMMNPIILVLLYITLMVVIVLLILPSWRYAFNEMKQNGLKTIVYIILGALSLYAMSLFLSVIISIFSTAQTSTNQTIINQNLVVAPMFMIFSVSIFAPIVEESIFRGGIYEYVQQKSNPLLANIISSFCFGFIHIYDSVIHLNFSDLPFLIVYMGLGCMLAHFYKNHGLIVSCGIHCLYNTISIILLLLIS